jgi:hypothetical protein
VKWSAKLGSYFLFNVLNFFSSFTHLYSSQYSRFERKCSPHPGVHSHTQRTAQIHKPLLIIARPQFPCDEKSTHRHHSDLPRIQVGILQYSSALWRRPPAVLSHNLHLSMIRYIHYGNDDVDSRISPTALTSTWF